MSSRQEQKAAARAAREAQEREAAKAATRKRRLGTLSGAVLVAAIVVAIVVAVSSGGGSAAKVTKGHVAKAADITRMMKGIPQHGNEVGKPGAPVVLEEFGDLKCPVCQEFDKQSFATLVNDYIRPGKLKMTFTPQAFVGEQYNPGDSPRAARFALAAAEQNKMWSLIPLFYANQQDETTRYVSDQFLTNLGSAIPGLNVQQALKDMDSAKIKQELKKSEQRFAANGFTGTPSFLLGGKGHTPKPFGNGTLPSTGQVTNAIDALLKG